MQAGAGPLARREVRGNHVRDTPCAALEQHGPRCKHTLSTQTKDGKGGRLRRGAARLGGGQLSGAHIQGRRRPPRPAAHLSSLSSPPDQESRGYQVLANLRRGRVAQLFTARVQAGTGPLARREVRGKPCKGHSVHSLGAARTPLQAYDEHANKGWQGWAVEERRSSTGRWPAVRWPYSRTKAASMTSRSPQQP